MARTTTGGYRNLLSSGAAWTRPINGVREMMLSLDTETGDYTKLVQFDPNIDTTTMEGGGVKAHDYPEEVLIIDGALFDVYANKWLFKGDYASRAPGEVHGPFKTGKDYCVVLEIAHVSQKQ